MTLQSVRDDPLGAVRIFAGLSEELRGELLGHAERSRLAAGEWVFRAGEPVAAMYVVLSGRLEVLIEQPEELVIRVLDRGAALGELALLTGKPRSASARARRDSELLKLTREAFGELIRSDAFARELLRALGEQRYWRLQVELTLASDDLDDASEGNLAKLRGHAEDLLRDRSADLDAALARL